MSDGAFRVSSFHPFQALASWVCFRPIADISRLSTVSDQLGKLVIRSLGFHAHSEGRFLQDVRDAVWPLVVLHLAPRR